MRRSKARFVWLTLVAAGTLAAGETGLRADGVRKLSGHVVPPSVTAGARPFEPGDIAVPLAIRLSMRDEGELDQLLEHEYRAGDSLYGKYLTPAEFAQRFGADPADIAQVRDYFRGLGCAIGTQYSNGLMLDAQCSRTAVERALGIKISYWLGPQGQVIQTIDRDPSIPEGLAIQAVHGLTNVPRHPQLIRQDQTSWMGTGSGPGGGLSPSDIRAAYDLRSVSAKGTGQALALFELDGYRPADIAAYASAFGITPAVPLQNVLVDGFNGSAGQGAPEVTLDIELMMAVAPGAARIVVYEGPNSSAGVIDTYQKIANDDLAQQISTSWGLAETFSSPAEVNTESQIFRQMAAQGQSIYSASGDSGAFDNGQSLSVDDPASQPYVTAAGGTTLTTNPDHSYSKETTWWNAGQKWGGGGGTSSFWQIPSWQVGAASAAAGASTTQRNVPDVALDSDPATGYSVYVGGGWAVYGGTSCAAPLWAAFTALVNEERASTGSSPLGYANPALYELGKGSGASTQFHDIADGSTNGHYPAVTGYDLATGWGTLQGPALWAALAGVSAPTPSPSPTPPPGGGGGCSFGKKPQNAGESTGAAVSMGLPFAAAFLTRRRKRRF